MNVPLQPISGVKESLSILAMIHRLVMKELFKGQRVLRNCKVQKRKRDQSLSD
jgi:hypothetical protein